jgi:uncharacterized membrane protein YfcA
MLPLPDLTLFQWLLAIVAAVGIGVAKAGFAGVGFIHIMVFALIFGPRESTGVILPMLIVADICAVIAFHQQARWDHLRRMLPPACIGVALGSILMQFLSDRAFGPLIGWIILGLTTLQLIRMSRPEWFGSVPHTRAFAWGTGLVAGVTTMVANAAGPIITLFALAVGLPKFELVGTSAWFFLVMNLFKVPFSFGLGLIHGPTLSLNLVLIPAILGGIAFGRWLTHAIPQALFDRLMLAFAAVAALRLVGAF